MIALLSIAAIAQAPVITLSGTGSTTAGTTPGVTVVGHLSAGGDHVSAIVVIGGVSYAMELKKGRTVGGMTYYSGTLKNADGMIVRANMVTSGGQACAGVSWSSMTVAGNASI
jgi:hypothetical protein